MRLLNTRNFQVKEFFTDIPKYAILSHTWEKQEVIFQDILDLEVAKRKFGWRKVEKACLYARKYNFQWIWIDSCCINKESSAELSEAINSMYQYYMDAEVCYVYLSDVTGKEDPRDAGSAFRHSRWFSRGWTLQELLAPTYAVFLDCNWTEIGTKWSLRDAISAITTIPRRVFECGDIDSYSIAQKMSWASRRETTRPEDQAYCLMGIFGISMSPIYGEGGTKAFMRLQQEIIKISDDRSIFAWIASEGDTEPRGLLARSPYEFRASGEVGVSDSDILGDKSSFSFNNNGLHIHIPLVQHFENSLFLASLHCQAERDGKYLSVYLQQTSGGRYIRCRTSELLLDSLLPPKDLKEIVVKESQVPRNVARKRTIALLPPEAPQYCIYCQDLSWRKRISGSNHEMVERTNLVYKTQGVNGEEFFSVAIEEPFKFNLITNTTEPGVPDVLRTTKLDYSKVFANLRSFLPTQDRDQARLDSGGFVSLALCLSGHSRARLEITYLPPEDLDIPILTKQLEQHPKLSFLVPNYFMNRQFGLKSVYPADYFQCQYDDWTYISVPEGGINSFRVLTYHNNSSQPKFFYVTIGFNDCKPWTDLLGLNEGLPPEIWSSYLDDGSRTSTRLACELVTLRTFYWHGVRRYLGVVATEGRNLQPGTHLVDIADTIYLHTAGAKFSEIIVDSTDTKSPMQDFGKARTPDDEYTDTEGSIFNTVANEEED
ncbi:hypothetical protein VKT23_015482 [Stygiomarasmius scandens]|uniref:Heterokaryon incompatibility domain-containing protein n=1 Tax=Marasmiellus scandens TaxID=2682957 RepID=A0ABR1J2A6_9AGAR